MEEPVVVQQDGELREVLLLAPDLQRLVIGGFALGMVANGGLDHAGLHEELRHGRHIVDANANVIGVLQVVQGIRGGALPEAAQALDAQGIGLQPLKVVV